MTEYEGEPPCHLSGINFYLPYPLNHKKKAIIEKMIIILDINFLTILLICIFCDQSLL